jgi:hypothetical protein
MRFVPAIQGGSVPSRFVTCLTYCWALSKRHSMRQMLYIPMVVLALGSAALAQIEPGLPGSIEYTVLSNNQTWIQTTDPITTGSYVEDLLTDRLNQPDGRGSIGIVTATGFDPDYGVMAATVDFGRAYSAGIVFPELSAIQIVPEPSTLVLLPAAVFWCAALRRRR